MEHQLLVYQIGGDSTIALLSECKPDLEIQFARRFAGFLEDNLPGIGELLANDYTGTEVLRYFYTTLRLTPSFQRTGQIQRSLR